MRSFSNSCYENEPNQGIWAGMIFGGTAVQTLILAIITIRCDWEKEVLSLRHMAIFLN